MLLRHLQYFVALARERHFARAAASCSVTQPTLSAGLKQLEEEMGVLLVRRGQRFEGLTPEGERVLEWAQRIVLDCQGLVQETSRMRGELHGQIRIGAVPTAMPLLPPLVTAFTRAHPHVTVSLLSRSSDEIQRGLDSHALDAGVTYLDNEPLSHVRSVPLFREQYMLLVPAGHAAAALETVRWADVPPLPYCFLTPDMQNRRIIDEQLGDARQNVTAVIETDSVGTLVALIRSGDWASIAPRSLVPLALTDGRMVARPLSGPAVEHELGLVVSDRETQTPAAQALLELARKLGPTLAKA